MFTFLRMKTGLNAIKALALTAIVTGCGVAGETQENGSALKFTDKDYSSQVGRSLGPGYYWTLLIRVHEGTGYGSIRSSRWPTYQEAMQQLRDECQRLYSETTHCAQVPPYDYNFTDFNRNWTQPQAPAGNAIAPRQDSSMCLDWDYANTSQIIDPIEV